MASPEVLDFATLLAPLPGDNPAGVDLRSDPSPNSLYYAVKDARSAARAAERQLVMDGEEAAPVDWRPVLQNATRALAGKSKDLEITAYLIEAVVRLHGFAGLRDGFRLARELAEQFWEVLYPLPDEDGVEARVSAITGLNGEDAEGTLINPIARVPLTEGNSVGPFAYFHYQQAVAVSRIQDEAVRESRLKQGAVSQDAFNRAVAETPAAFFTTLVEDIGQCQDEFAKLGQVLEDKCGSHAPPASNIRAALASCLEAVTSFARDKLAVALAPEEGPAEDAAGGEAAAGANGAAEGAGALRTREDAFRMLAKVADFFRRTEPHTPVSYALDQVVRWGQMPLPELLTELIPDEAARLQFFKMVGIRSPDQAGG